MEVDHLGSELHGQNFYKLYFCDAKLIKDNQYFSKNSMEMILFLELVPTWMQENQCTVDSFEYTIGMFISELFEKLIID